jgi:superfamily II DNA or RNA helicase
MELYPYQIDVIRKIEGAIESGKRCVLLQAATGSGKTVIAAELIKRATARKEGVVFLAHRYELITQTSDKLLSFGIDHAILKAGFPMHLHKRVQVASVPTLFSRAVRGKKIDMPRAKWLFVDEAHHVRAMSYMRIVDAYPDGNVIGLTATPCRHDGRGLGNVFEALIECLDIRELTQQGFVVPARVFAPVRPDLTGVRVQRGDYVESELAARVDTGKLVGDIVEHWHRLGEQRPTVCFAVNVPHSRHIQREFDKAGVPCGHIDGSTPLEDRTRTLGELTAGKLNVVTNCMVLTEGWDCPTASCEIIARPTKSLGLFRQMIGRILRPAPGKTDAIVLDHAGGVFAHGLPDDHIEWTLDQDTRAENHQHSARGTGPYTPQLVTCPKCSAVRLEGKPCPVCGWQPQRKPSAVEFDDGELGEIGRDRQPKPTEWTVDQQFAFYRQLMGYGRLKGYKQAWCAHKFSERFGQFPPWAWNRAEPMTPSGAVQAWVRSRNLAYVRSLGR